MPQLILPAKGVPKKRPIQVATRCTVYHEGTTMNGTVAGTTYRYRHVMRSDCHDIQLVFGNHYATGTSESSNTNAITIQAAIEYNSQITRVHFDGEEKKTLGQGGMAITDPVLRNIPKDTVFYVRTWVSVPVDNDQVPQHLLMTGSGDGKAAGNVATSTGALTSAPTEKGYGPSAIIGIPDADDAVAIGLIGDSIVAYADGTGWPVDLVEPDYGYIIMSRPTSTAASMESNSGNVYRLRYAQFLTHTIVNFGTNDFNSAEAFDPIYTRMQVLWKRLKAAGLEVYHSTTMPRSSGTFTTLSGQTRVNTNSYDDKRKLFNSKLRSDPSVPVKVLDVAAIVEGAPGVWMPNFTTDGIHPEQAAKDAILANIKLQ